MQEFEVSLEILHSAWYVVGEAMGVSILVVSAASLVVSGFKALLRMIGR